MTHAIATFLDQIELGPPKSFERLTLWPLQHKKATPSPPRPAYRPLAEALERGEVIVEEVSDTGSVPNVRVRNLCDDALLVLFGEELRGAKQNRIANASFLIPPQGTIVIDVSCVEAGRWHSAASGRGAGRAGSTGSSPRFDSSGPLVSHALRRSMHSAISESRASGRGFHSDQGEVWSEIGQRLRDSGASSSSSAWSDYHATRSKHLDAARAVFAPGGVGFVAAIDGEVVGMEAIGEAAVYARSFARLLDAYLIDALEEAPGGAAATEGSKPPDPAAFLARVHDAPVTVGPSLGLGEDLRLRSDDVEGAALVAGGVVHLTVAPRVEAKPRPGREFELDRELISEPEAPTAGRRPRRSRDVA